MKTRVGGAALALLAACISVTQGHQQLGTVLAEVAGANNSSSSAAATDIRLMEGMIFTSPQKPEPLDPLDESNFKEETDMGFLPVSVECVFAAIFVGLIGSVPFLLVCLTKAKLTTAHKVESICLMAWLFCALVLFCNFLHFNSGSGHWQGARPLTIVEAVYLLSQILTTVGYGDITPAYPLSQVWVAVNVILALCLYGSIIMEVCQLVNDRLERALAPLLNSSLENDDARTARVQAEAAKPLVDWTSEKGKHVNYSNLMKSVLAFITMVFIGVLFWHFFPGEEKTWLQAVYFSVITLSTVGFGAITAVTPGGMVFGAFWMLFGVAALAGVIGSFVEVMIQIKASERLNPSDQKIEFFKHLKTQSRDIPSLRDMGMDRYDFLKFGVLLTQLASEEEISHFEERFAFLKPGEDGKITMEQIIKMEAPPGYSDVKTGGDEK